MSGPAEYNQMPREPAPAMIVEPNHSEQPRLVEPMKMEQSTSLRGGKADGGVSHNPQPMTLSLLINFPKLDHVL
ncbi:hypothetical protein CGCVW01_v004756 [Colletotrichum viniferum]|nr:hypothetical protein CGCVW01_v004756 [Colletotrichum viniferum]